MASEYESTLLEAWQRKQDAIPVLLADNLRKEREIAALREQLATTASDGDQTLTMLVNAQNGALLTEVEQLTRERDELAERERVLREAGEAMVEAARICDGMVSAALMPGPREFEGLYPIDAWKMLRTALAGLRAALATAGGEQSA